MFTHPIIIIIIKYMLKFQTNFLTKDKGGVNGNNEF